MIYQLINQEGLDLIKEFEGLELNAYRDAVGVWTIGYGHTRTTTSNMVITEKKAEALLLEDIKDAEDAVNKMVLVPLNENQFSALVSFVFNLGAGNFKKSTLLKEINKNNWLLAANEFDKWVYAGGKVLNGLVRRRKAEKELFLKGINNG